jgi:hypothetical protein
MKEREKKRMKIALFGHFDATSLGNESTLQAVLYHLHCCEPDAEVACISTGSEFFTEPNGFKLVSVQLSTG